MENKQFEELLKALTAIAVGIQKLNEKLEILDELPEIVEAIDRVANSI